MKAKDLPVSSLGKLGPREGSSTPRFRRCGSFPAASKKLEFSCSQLAYLQALAFCLERDALKAVSFPQVQRSALSVARDDKAGGMTAREKSVPVSVACTKRLSLRAQRGGGYYSGRSGDHGSEYRRRDLRAGASGLLTERNPVYGSAYLICRHRSTSFPLRADSRPPSVSFRNGRRSG